MLSKPEEREAYNFKLEQALRDEDDDFTGVSRSFTPEDQYAEE